MVEISVAMVRNMALLLRPSMLDDLGLEAAIGWQASQISRATGVRIQIEAAGIPEELPEEHKICVFRVVQEALNNVCKHARATSAEIHLRGQGERLAVTVRDDGRGFRTPHQSGLGLLGIHERVESLGGTMTVRSEPGKGATLEISLPLPRSAAASREPANA